MSEENVELVRRAFEAFNRGDLDAALADLAPNFEYVPSGAIPGASDIHRGPDGMKRFAGWLLDQFDDVRIEVHEAFAQGDRVFVWATNRGRGRRSGAETSWEVWQVFTMHGGKAVRGEAFRSREQAIEAAGLQE